MPPNPTQPDKPAAHDETRILIVSRSAPLRRRFRQLAVEQGWLPLEASSQTRARELVAAHGFALAIVEIAPTAATSDSSGADPSPSMALAQELAKTYATPVIVLGPDRDVPLATRCLDFADDYLPRPVDAAFLLAKAKVVLRLRADKPPGLDDPGAGYIAPPPAGPRLIAGVQLNMISSKVTQDGRPDVPMSKSLFDVLALLVENAGELVTHEALAKPLGIDLARGKPARESLRMQVKRLRQILGTIDGLKGVHCIVARPRLGYEFRRPGSGKPNNT